MKNTAARSNRSSYDFSDDDSDGSGPDVNDGVNGSASQLTPENSFIGIEAPQTPHSGGGGLQSSLRKGGQPRLSVTPG